jgi:hypothetical protein
LGELRFYFAFGDYTLDFGDIDPLAVSAAIIVA